MTVSISRIHTKNLKKIGQYLDIGTKPFVFFLQAEAHWKNQTSFGPTGKELESWPQVFCGYSTHWDGHFAVFKSTVAQKTKKFS